MPRKAYNIPFQEKRYFFRRCMTKIAKICAKIADICAKISYIWQKSPKFGENRRNYVVIITLIPGHFLSLNPVLAFEDSKDFKFFSFCPCCPR
jgi:hypothetical protein